VEKNPENIELSFSDAVPLSDEVVVSKTSKGGKARMDQLSPEGRKELARTAAIARWKARKSAARSAIENKKLQVIVRPQGATPQQSLPLGITRQVEIDGVGMGVLSDGTAFLTGRGLSRLCGIGHAQIQRLSADWIEGASKQRIDTIKDLLRQRGIPPAERPYIPLEQRSGVFFAYPDFVCLAILEYYAFEADTPQQEARKNFRLLAGAALREFIYREVGYDPNNSVPDVWKQFHDRVSLTYNAVPKGYFGIFKEMADMIVTLGQSGLHIDSKFVPDISVGQHWSKYWTENNLAERYAERRKFEHNYPDYFPQSPSNPQDSWCYPEIALGEFRKWLREVYIGEGKFAKYITGQAEKRMIPVTFAQLAIAAYEGDS
jgi:hypothetical protein